MQYWDYVQEKLPTGKIQWPEGKRIAILVCFDYQSEVGNWSFPDGTPNYGQLTEASYGGRVGIWRILDILDRQGVKATFNVCGVTAERYPESAKAIVDRGHEIGGHAYHHELQWKLAEKEETEVIRKSIDAIQRITGERIVGWRCPLVQPSQNTLRILCDEGFVWDSDFLNYDLPYMLTIGDKELVEIPYTFSTDDFPFLIGSVSHEAGGFPTARNTPADLYGMWKDEFDVLYAESEADPKMFIFQNHPFVMGRAHRAKYFEMFLSYIKGHEDVWFARCIDVADWWLKRYRN
ncbi:MAG: polysaccharide deacetylase family protein [Nitrospinota bacterium]